MRFRWSALAVCVLALGLMPRAGLAQGSPPAKAKATLKQNYPNPFNPETRGDFSIDDPPACPAGGVQHRVSVKIYNLLSQLVAVPQLQRGTGGVAGGQRLDNVLLPCGTYTWYWNGNYDGTSQEASSGIYLLVLQVDGTRTMIKMTVAK